MNIPIKFVIEGKTNAPKALLYDKETKQFVFANPLVFVKDNIVEFNKLEFQFKID